MTTSKTNSSPGEELPARRLTSLAEIGAAGAAAVRDHPPLTEKQLDELAVLIAPAFRHNSS